MIVEKECLGHVDLTFCLSFIALVPTKHIVYPSFFFPSLYICRVVVDPTFAGWIEVHWRFADESCLSLFFTIAYYCCGNCLATFYIKTCYSLYFRLGLFIGGVYPSYTLFIILCYCWLLIPALSRGVWGLVGSRSWLLSHFVYGPGVR